MKDKFRITGMSCSACSARVEKVVSKMDGVNTVSVNLLTGTMQVTYDESEINAEKIIKAVEGAGYGAFKDSKAHGSAGADVRSVTGSSSASPAVAEAKQMKVRLVSSVALLIGLMIFSMGPMITGNHDDMNHPLTMILIQVVFLIPIVFLNRKYFVKGFPSLFRGSPNMDSLIAVGAGAGIVYGVFAVFRIVYGYETGNMELVHRYSGDIYFESSAMILTLITVGKYMEAKSKRKTGEAIEKLMNLAPKTASVERDGAEIKILTEELVTGDILVVRPGESIAADGTIISGMTGIDESLVTGESIPVEKQTGDKVISATINKSGFIKVRCERVGEDTTISQIIRLVDEAGASKAPIAKMADKIAGIFVPAVMAIALISAVVWLISGAGFEFALSIGISVLVISCPCALGLATPVAIMVGTGKGAENGILIKSGEALETAHRIDTVVMDKTGTITWGKPKVTDVAEVWMNEDELLKIASALESGSEHPLSEAIMDYTAEKNISIPQVRDFQAVFGRGIKGVIDGKHYIGGNTAFIEDCGIDTSFGKAQARLENFADNGKTPIIFADADDKKILGIIAVADTEKEGSRIAIEEFAKMNIDVVMLTGDNKRTAEALRKKLNIPKVIAEVLPADKESHIAKLQAEGRHVAMIGDGINDAPALAKADVGIAIGAGTDVAIESADAVLMRSDLRDAVTAVKLSKAVIKNIKQNLFWAFFYNIIGIPLASGVLYPMFGLKLSPMYGAVAMSLSSLFVVSNALRLRNFNAGRKDEKMTETINKETERKKEMKYELKIEGMMCMHCQKHMTDALNEMEGVSAEVDLEKGMAYVTAEREISMDEFEKVVEGAGYTLKRP